MKIDYPELQDRYDDFWEIQQNALEIFGEIETGFAQYRSLDSFQGNAATKAKAYLEEVHSKVVDTFEILLMDYETRMFLMRNEFGDSVDSNSAALIDTEYVQELISQITTYENDFDSLATAIDAAANPVSELAGISAPFDTQPIADGYTSVKKDGNAVIDDVESFDSAHSQDMVAINSVFSNLDQAFELIGSVLSNTEVNYTSGQLVEAEWSQNLAQYRLDAVAYAETNDPGFYESCYVAMLVNSGIPLVALINDLAGYADDANDVRLMLQEAYKLYKSGVNFVLNEHNGRIYLQLSDASMALIKTSQMQAIAKNLELDIGKNAAEQLFGGNGLRIFNIESGTMHNPKMWSNIADKGDALSDVARQVNNANGVSIGVLDVIGWVVSAGINVHDAHYDARSGRYETPSAESLSDAARNTKIDIAVDVGATVAGAAAGAKIGALFGSFAGPIGTAAGVVIGTGIGVVLNLKLGEPPKSIVDHAKGFFEDVDTFFDNCWLRLWG